MVTEKVSSHKGPTPIQPECGIKMHFSGFLENENLPCRTDSLRYSSDHPAVTVGPDVKYVWVEPTLRSLNEETSNWEKVANVMPFTILAYWASKKNMIPDVRASLRPGEMIVCSLQVFISDFQQALTTSRRTLDGVFSSTVWMSVTYSR